MMHLQEWSLYLGLNQPMLARAAQVGPVTVVNTLKGKTSGSKLLNNLAKALAIPSPNIFKHRPFDPEVLRGVRETAVLNAAMLRAKFYDVEAPRFGKFNQMPERFEHDKEPRNRLRIEAERRKSEREQRERQRFDQIRSRLKGVRRGTR
jgi:hypothetical protein